MPLLAVVISALASGMALGLAGKVLFRPPQPVFGAALQCAFRFNSYIGLALAARLGGDGRTAAALVSYGVAARLVTLPLWLAVANGTSG